MTIRADADIKFLRKYLFIAFACFAFAAYCLVDGIVLAPNKMARTEKYAELSHIEDGTERSQKWQEICEAENWSFGIPEKTPAELRTYIVWQYVMAAGCIFIVGLPMTIWYFRNKGRWVEADEKSIRGSWGPEVQFSSIEKLDKKKWKKKGIAQLFYNQGGATKKFVLDDFKFSRKPMGEIMELVEANLTPEQILNDEPTVVATTKSGGVTSENT